MKYVHPVSGTRIRTHNLLIMTLLSKPLDLLASLNSYEKVNKYVVPNPKQFKWKANKKTVGYPNQQMGYFSITNTIG